MRSWLHRASGSALRTGLRRIPWPGMLLLPGNSSWTIVRRSLRKFPFVLAEFQDVIGKTLVDFRALQPKVLDWDDDHYTLVVTCLEEWQVGFSTEALMDDEATASAEAMRDGTLLRDTVVRPIYRCSFVDAAVVVLFGDPIQPEERTHFLAVCSRKQLRVVECGWDLQMFRGLDFNNVGAVHCNISSSWEVRDGLVLNHGWGTLTF